MPSSPKPTWRRVPQTVSSAEVEDRLGFFFPLLLVYPVFEYGRPAHPLGIPMILSSILFLGWLADGKKKWRPQLTYFFALVAVMCVGTVLAANTRSAFLYTYGLTVTLVGTCVPLMHFATSLRRIGAFIGALLAAFVYAAFYALTHKGWGPGWQDENYLAALMAIAFPFAYFSIFTVKRMFVRVALAIAAGLFIAGVVASFSRGGFIGMAAVLFYCVLRSPTRWPLFLVGPVVAIAIALFATPEYWSEMQTISDPGEQTASLRLDLWKIAFWMFEDNPLIGIGPGNYLWNVGDYQSLEQFERYQRSLAASAVTHSLYFELLAELGLAGVILVSATLYRNYADLRFVARETRRHIGTHANTTALRRAQYYERAITGGFVGVLVCGLTVSMLYYSYIWILTAMAVSLNEVTRGLLSRADVEAVPVRPPAGEWRRRTHLATVEG